MIPYKKSTWLNVHNFQDSLKNDICHLIGLCYDVFLEIGSKTSVIEIINGMVIYFNYKSPKDGKSFG